ncbi:DNA cytosine methyltransferase [Hydrocarboniphaga effusa]|uniref:DNA cytosine methyltransferase n=1 Tax=Hydrocarboniphaga effusa TaxID=243629 RepID=UPI00398C2050
MTAYYNEIEPYAAQWLRNLIDAGHIAPGYVDERSIEDVYPSDLRGFTQCHFFAGIGGWSYALRLAGWGDDRPVWTGSCPCQPFSAAGKGLGFADERHLWPAWFHLVKECKPPVVFGEQVASKDADSWIDLVQGDLEALDYAFGAIPFPSAGVGAPHIRDRIYWMADSMRGRARNHAGKGVAEEAALDRRDGGLSRQRLRTGFEGSLGILADDDRQRFDREQICVQPRRPLQDCVEASRGCGTGLLGNAGNAGNAGLSQRIGVNGMVGEPARADAWQAAQRAGIHAIAEPGPLNGFWSDADWLLCTDGRWRPVEPGTFPLAHGAPARVGRLRAYGNAINAEAAKVFIRSVMEAA